MRAEAHRLLVGGSEARAATPRSAVLGPSGAVLAVTLCFALVFGVFWPTTRSMIEIWERSETFQHCYVVLPIVVWLVWISRARLASTPVRPFWPGLLAIALLGFGWMLASLGAVLVVEQLAVVGLAGAVVLTALGLAWFRILWFPLLFLFFAVPFGEAAVPQLMAWTADFTVGALRLSGVPVYREGMNFVIPSGRWSVVEACSGVRYLMASVMTGTLFAWLMYRSPLRRGLFIAVSIVVPVIANWLRAYGIVMLGHLSGNKIAAGVDHLIYGWIFFGVVILAVFLIGARWREDDVQTVPVPSAPPVAAATGSYRSLLMSAAVVAASLLAWPAAHAVLSSMRDERPLQALQVVPAGGWATVEEPVSGWRPLLEGPVREERITFAKDGRRVTLIVGMYRNQRQGSELINAMNRVAASSGGDAVVLWQGHRPMQDARGTIDANASVVRIADGEFAIVHWYWLGSTRTTSDARGKLDLAFDRLLVRGDTSAWVSLHAAAPAGIDSALPVLAEFMRDMGGGIDAALYEVARK